MEIFMKDRPEIQAVIGKKEDDSLRNEVLGDARLMSELHSLGLSEDSIDHYLPLLITYLDQRNATEDPTKSLEIPYPGMTMRLRLDDSGFLIATFGLGEETKRREQLEANYLYRDFPDEWVALSTKSLLGERYKKVRLAISKTFKKNNAKPWVFLQGDPGTGKSYFLAAVTNGLAAGGGVVCFMNANQRFDELKNLAIKDHNRFLYNMDALKKCETMVIDDFGSEYKSEYVRDQVIMPLLCERSRAGLRTYFTSQFSLEDIKRLYSLRGSTIEGEKLANTIRRNIEEPTILTPGLETVKRQKKSN